MITISPKPFVHAKNSWFVPYGCTVGLRFPASMNSSSELQHCSLPIKETP